MARSDRLLCQALPFAIKERLAVPVADLHIANVGVRDPRAVAVIAYERLQHRLQQVRALRLQPLDALSQAHLLPAADSEQSEWKVQTSLLRRLSPLTRSGIFVLASSAAPAQCLAAKRR